jgi:hypothetical protein
MESSYYHKMSEITDTLKEECNRKNIPYHIDTVSTLLFKRVRFSVGTVHIELLPMCIRVHDNKVCSVLEYPSYNAIVFCTITNTVAVYTAGNCTTYRYK